MLTDKLKSDLIFAVAQAKQDAIDETIAELLLDTLRNKPKAQPEEITNNQSIQ